MHCTRPQAGHPPLDATPAGPRGELAAGTSSPMHPSQCHILCRWSYRSLLPTYPPCWHCPGQRAEHRVFSTLCPGHSQAWGFSIGLERVGWEAQGGDPDNKEIGSQLALRWDGLHFLIKVPWPSCPARKQICCTHFTLTCQGSLSRAAVANRWSSDHLWLATAGLGCIILIHLGLNFHS